VSDPPTDDAHDNRLGVLCNDGLFELPINGSWPLEAACSAVDTCTAPYFPPEESGFVAVDTTLEIPTGDSIFYGCKIDGAILSDDSGLSSFEVVCDGTEWKTRQPGGSLAVLDTGSFPTCLAVCSDFDVGKQYTLKSPDPAANVTVRTGDLAEFECDEGFYVSGTSDFSVSSITRACQWDGNEQSISSRH